MDRLWINVEQSNLHDFLDASKRELRGGPVCIFRVYCFDLGHALLPELCGTLLLSCSRRRLKKGTTGGKGNSHS